MGFRWFGAANSFSSVVSSPEKMMRVREEAGQRGFGVGLAVVVELFPTGLSLFGGGDLEVLD